MRSTFLPCLLPILLSLPTLNIYRDSTCGRFPSVFADPTATTTIARGILRVGNRPVIINTTACCASGIIASDYGGDVKDRNNTCRFIDDGECNSASHMSSSQSLCIRSLTTQSGFFLRTLYRHHNLEEENEYENDEKNSKYSTIDFCWDSIRDTGENMAPWTIYSSYKQEHDTTVAVIASLPSTVRLNSSNSNSNNNKNDEDKVRLQSLARKVDLLFSTRKVQNNEITLPRSISELYRREKSRPDLNTPDEAMSSLYSKRPIPLSMSSTSSTIPRLSSITKRLSRGDVRVDLTGRWRPAKSVSTQDLANYDEFLKACCSDSISYWTRKLLTSSSIVSRQEFVVKQLDEGRIVEFVDIHPLSSNVWNRTIVTSRNPMNSSGSRLGENSSLIATEHNINLDDYKCYANRLKDPQGDSVIVEAYWQENGTVHTSFLRKAANDNVGDHSAKKGWLETRRYLFSGYNHLETHEEEQDEKNRVMVVETIYHSTPFPVEIESTLKARSNSKSFIETNLQGEGTATKMIWKWEQVI